VNGAPLHCGVSRKDKIEEFLWTYFSEVNQTMFSKIGQRLLQH
jgi:hypothetical protein